MATETIAEEQAKFQQWYAEWLALDKFDWPHSAESLLAYFKARLCAHIGSR